MACDLETGSCAEADAPDGTPCDTDPCIDGATCLQGACTGGVPKPANCADKVCGLDDCGKSCGECQPSEICSDGGQCEPDPSVVSCGQVTHEGCCGADGLEVQWCEEDALQQMTCETGLVCSWYSQEDYYTCVTPNGVEPSPPEHPYACSDEPCQGCGDGDCGWRCGELCPPCAPGEVCQGNTCVGSACGECAVGEICVEPLAECVPDPCSYTDVKGCCQIDLLVFCENDQPGYEQCDSGCGWVADKSWYDCDGQGEDPSGNHPIACVTDPGPDEFPDTVESTGPEIVEAMADAASTETFEADDGPTSDSDQ